MIKARELLPTEKNTVATSLSGKRLVLCLSIALIALSQLNNHAYTPSFPALAESFAVNFRMIKLSFILSAAFFGLSQLIYGPLSDKYGRKAVVKIGLSLFLAATLISANAHSITVFLLGRMLQGIGVGCAGPVASAMIRDVASGKQLNKMFSYVSLAIFFTPVAGPMIGGCLQQFLGWQAVFGFVFLYAGLLYLVFFNKYKETNMHLCADKLSVKTLLKKYLGIYKNKEYSSYLTMMILLFSGEIIYLMQLPQIIQIQLGYTPLMNGQLMIFIASGVFIGSSISAMLIETVGLPKLFMAGIALTLIASLSMLVIALLNVTNLFVIIAPMSIYMLGSGILFPNCIAGCLQQFTSSHGVASALMSGTLMFCSALLSSISVLLPVTNQNVVAIYMLIATGCLAGVGYKKFTNKKTAYRLV